MLKKLAYIALSLIFAGATASFAAQNFGSKDEAVAMVERVAAQYTAEGLEATAAAIMDQSNSDYHDRDLYAFIIDHEGLMIAHGANAKLVGRNLIGLKDQSGKTFIVEMIEISKSSTPGWVSYNWTNPTTKKVDAKASYVVPLGDNMFAGVGVYEN